MKYDDKLLDKDFRKQLIDNPNSTIQQLLESHVKNNDIEYKVVSSTKLITYFVMPHYENYNNTNMLEAINAGNTVGSGGTVGTAGSLSSVFSIAGWSTLGCVSSAGSVGTAGSVDVNKK